MDKKEQGLLNQAQNAKLIHLNEQTIFPLLNRKIDEKLSSLCESFKTDGVVRMGDVAYIAACRDIVAELKSAADRGDRAAAKLNLNPPIE